jgi:hypothetical protein
MPETVVEVEDAINEAVAEANAVLCNNPNVLEEYERRCKQVSCTFFQIFSVIDPNFSAHFIVHPFSVQPSGDFLLHYFVKWMCEQLNRQPFSFVLSGFQGYHLF